MNEHPHSKRWDEPRCNIQDLAIEETTDQDRVSWVTLSFGLFEKMLLRSPAPRRVRYSLLAMLPYARSARSAQGDPNTRRKLTGTESPSASGAAPVLAR